eukprot:TRINITY_DN9189_c0_g1_i1.p1 TRINITY_DN9189_c0_g1~~TRINITY_DN9189_c0_g1_i1.p1  ORF type:complete len:605 (-),score=58.13 TRINITY_DN9189_c0_g1_i1:14-1828(-)
MAAPYTFTAHPTRGREIIATRALALGDLIFSEKSFASVPSHSAITNNTHCFLCCLPLLTIPSPDAGHVTQCPSCKHSFCGTECASSGLHKHECTLLQPLLRISHECGSDYPTLLLAFRCLLMRDGHPEGWKRVSCLAGHVSLHDADYLAPYKAVAQFLEPTRDPREEVPHALGPEVDLSTLNLLFRSDVDTPGLSSGSVDPSLLPVLACVIHVNAFGGTHPTTRQPISTGVFPLAAMMSHSCQPNAYYKISGSTMEVRAIRDIAQGEPICDTYVDLLDTTIQRQEKLMRDKFFFCDCSRCRDPSECGRYMSGITCLPCQGKGDRAYILPNILLKDGKITDVWGCERCGCGGSVSDLALVGEVRRHLDGLYRMEWMDDPARFIANQTQAIPPLFSRLHPQHQLRLFYHLHVANAYARAKTYNMAIPHALEVCAIARLVLPDPVGELSDCYTQLGNLCQIYSSLIAAGTPGLKPVPPCDAVPRALPQSSAMGFSFSSKEAPDRSVEIAKWTTVSMDAFSVAQSISVKCKGESVSLTHPQYLQISSFPSPSRMVSQVQQGMQQAMKNVCAVCQQGATSCCSRCNRVYYCTKDHQVSHWSTHKKECTK